jgi:putative transposase
MCSENGARIVNLVKVSGIPKSVYYYQRNNVKKQNKDALVLMDIKMLPQRIQNTYGSKPMSKEFLSHGVRYNHKRLARIRKEHGIASKIRRRRFPKEYYKTLRENKANVPRNILERNFKASRPMEKLVADITYFKVIGGWLYLNGILDLYNGELISHSFSRNIDEILAIDSVNKLRDNQLLSGALLHTDQGSTYIGKKYRKLLEDYGVTQSMSRRGNCWDNACMEQFFGTLKCETIYLEKKQALLPAAELIKKLDEYIYFYNNTRIKKKLNWLSPVKFRELAA